MYGFWRWCAESKAVEWARTKKLTQRCYAARYTVLYFPRPPQVPKVTFLSKQTRFCLAGKTEMPQSATRESEPGQLQTFPPPQPNLLRKDYKPETLDLTCFVIRSKNAAENSVQIASIHVPLSFELFPGLIVPAAGLPIVRLGSTLTTAW